MIWIISVMYLWAGATTAWTFRLFDEIQQAMDEALPFKESIASVKYSIGIAITVGMLWPVVLPIWLMKRNAT